MLQQLPKISRFSVGIVFLLSGLLKAIDTASFSDLMSQYGAVWFGLAAPLVIFIEICLGLMLIFGFYPQKTTLATIIFLVSVSLIYIYGVTYRGITDCGCFGPLTWLNSKPWLTFTRNGILLVLLLPTLIFQNEDKKNPTISTIIFMSVVAVVVMFMCGFSMRGAKCLQKEHTFEPIALSDSPLSNYVLCDKDSTYMVFAFSYTCPYCQNSIGNVNQYQPMGMVDKVIGLAVEDSVARRRFQRLFDTNFEIREISELSMYRITRTLPTSFIIRHDSIINQYTGMVISPALLVP